MARGDRDVARRAKSGGFGAVQLGFITDALSGNTRGFTLWHLLESSWRRGREAACEAAR